MGTATTIDNRYTYTGREKNPVSGTMYYRFRNYNPTLGRWSRRDPIRYAGGINVYGYVYNKPVNYFDPYGLSSWAKRKAMKKVKKIISQYENSVFAECFGISTFKKTILEFMEKRWSYSFKSSIPWYYSFTAAGIYLPTINRLFFDPDGGDFTVLHETIHFFDDFNDITINADGAESLTYGVEAIFDTLSKLDTLYNNVLSPNSRSNDTCDTVKTLWGSHTKDWRVISNWHG